MFWDDFFLQKSNAYKVSWANYFSITGSHIQTANPESKVTQFQTRWILTETETTQENGTCGNPSIDEHQWTLLYLKELEEYMNPMANIQCCHYSDVIMGAMASQITGVSIVCSTVYAGVDQRKHQSSVSLAFVRGIHRWPVNSCEVHIKHHYELSDRTCIEWVFARVLLLKLIWDVLCNHFGTRNHWDFTQSDM